MISTHLSVSTNLTFILGNYFNIFLIKTFSTLLIVLSGWCDYRCSFYNACTADIHPRCPVVEDKQKRCTTTIKRIDNSGEKSNFGGFSNTMNIPKKKSEDDFYMEDSSLTDDGNLRSITNSTRHVMSDEDGVIISSSPTIKPRVSTGQIQEEILDPILDFFKQNTNYDLMPYSGKVIVFDIDLPVREAFQVAANNGTLPHNYYLPSL